MSPRRVRRCGRRWLAPSALVVRAILLLLLALVAVALSHMQAAGFRFQSGDRATINGLDAFLGVYQGQIEGLGELTSRAAHIAHRGQYYFVAGLVVPPCLSRLTHRSGQLFVRSVR